MNKAPRQYTESVFPKTEKETKQLDNLPRNEAYKDLLALEPPQPITRDKAKANLLDFGK